MESETKQQRIERYFRTAISAYLVLLVLAMYPFTNDPTGDIKRLIVSWGGALLGIGWIGAVGLRRLPAWRPGNFFPLLVAFLALYFLATLFSGYRWPGLLETASFCSFFMLYVVSSQVFHTTAQVRRCFLVLCGVVAAASFYGFMQKSGVDPFPWDDRSGDVYTGLPATFGNPNFAAHVLILAIILAAYLLFTGLRWRWAGLLLLFFSTHLYYTGQRAGLIALAAGAFLVMVAWVVGRRAGRPVRGAILSLALVAAIGIGGLTGAMAISKWRTGTAMPLDASLIIRYQSYVSAADMLFDHPLLGHGPGVYAITYPEYWSSFEQEWFAQELRMNAHVHNDLMEIGIDAGLPAAGIYLSLLVLGMGYGLIMAFSPGTKERRRLGFMFAAFFLAFLVDGLFGFNLRVPVSAALFFLALGILDGIWAAESSAPSRGFGKAPSLLPHAASSMLLIACVVLETMRFAGAYNMQQGMRAMKQQNYPQARQAFSRGKSFAPWDESFERRLGQVCVGEHNLEEAETHFERAVQINPDYVLNRMPLAQTQMALAQRAVQQNPNAADIALKKLDGAAGHLNALLKICPVFPDAHDLLGRVASISALFVTQSGAADAPDRARAYWKTAEEHLLEAIQYELKNQSELYRMLAKVRLALGDEDGAEQALVHAAQADPADTETWPIFLDSANRQKRYDRLRNTLYAQIQRMKEAEPRNDEALTTAYLYLANVLENGYSDWDAVDQAFLAAAEYGPLRPEVWTNLARYARDKNRPMALHVAIAQSCGNLAVAGKAPLPYVAAVNDVMQRGPEALENATAGLLSQVRAFRPSDSLSIGQTFGWAAAMLLEALKGAPDTKATCTSCFNLGIVLAGLNELETADQLFTRAESCLDASQKAFLAVHWADVRVRQGRTPEALELLRTARQQAPANMDVQWALARTYAKLEMRDEARAEYEALLAIPDLAPQGRAMIEQELKAILPPA